MKRIVQSGTPLIVLSWAGVVFLSFFRNHPDFIVISDLLAGGGSTSGINPAPEFPTDGLSMGAGFMASLGPAAVSTLIFLVSFLIGNRLIFQFTGTAQTPPLIQALRSTGAGIVLLSHLGFLLASIGAVNPYILATLALVVLVVTWRDLPAQIRKMLPISLPRERWIVSAIFSLMFFLLLLQASCPPTSWDALAYHLTLPKSYLTAGAIEPIDRLLLSHTPQGLNMIYMLALRVSTGVSARLVHLGIGVLTFMTLFALVRRLSSAEAAWVAVLMASTITVATQTSTLAYVDMGVPFFIFLALEALLEWKERKDDMMLLLVGGFAGFAVSVKLIAAPYYLALLLSVGIIGLTVRHALLFVGASSMTGGLWFLRNIWLTGNPLHPFYSVLFTGKPPSEMVVDLLEFVHRFGMEEAPVDYVLLPWRLSVTSQFHDPRHYDGVLGPSLLALALIWIGPLRPPRGAAASWRENPWMPLRLLVTCSFLWWLATTHQARFLIGLALALTAILSPCLIGFNGLYPRAGKALRGILILVSVSNIIFYHNACVQNHVYSYLLGNIDRDQYIRQNLTSYGGMQYLNAIESKEVRVATIYEPRGFYLEKEYVYDSVFSSIVGELLTQSTTADDFFRSLKERKITHFLGPIRGWHLFERTYADPADCPRVTSGECGYPAGRECQCSTPCTCRNQKVWRRFQADHMEKVYADQFSIVYAVRSVSNKPRGANAAQGRTDLDTFGALDDRPRADIELKVIVGKGGSPRRGTFADDPDRTNSRETHRGRAGDVPADRLR